MNMFIGRKNELKYLEDLYRKNENGIIIIYGRRRIGKTRLVLEFIKNKPAIYFLSQETTLKNNIDLFAKELAKYLKNKLFEKANFNSFEELFIEFSKIVKKKTIIVIDEFPYLIKIDNSVVSQFQRIWDLYLSKKRIFLILLGSSISMMESHVLSYSSPLYGRRIGQIKITPLKISEIIQFLNDRPLEENIKIYGVADGIPLYLQLFNGLNFDDALKTHVFNKAGFLNQEALFLLKSEFRELNVYLEILKSIAFGKNKFGEIINFTSLNSSKLISYLNNLLKVHIIKKSFPVISKKEIRNARYVLEDNYFRFWFRFIYPYNQLIEVDKIDEVISLMNKDLSQYMGFVFEVFVEKFFREYFSYQKVGKWWYKDKEIDVVAINEPTREIAFVESKWRSNVNAEKILRDLKEKAKYVNWRNDKRIEYFYIFAKSFKKRVNEKNVKCIDLKGLEKIIRAGK